jgi:predicted hydrocarbon binding protein
VKELLSDSSRSESNSLLERAKFDEDKGELTIAEMDWILMGGSTLRALIDGIMSLLGAGGVPILFEAGRNAGKEFANAILKEGMLIQELPKWLMAFFTWSGWGKIWARVDFNNKQATVEIYNCATARGIQSKEPSCHFIRGYIAGIGEVLFSSPTECTEIKCLSKGDTSCFFRVQRKTD